jgi:hypothetical protein
MTRRTFLAAPLLAAVPGAMDSDGMLRIRGRRRFVLGLYHLPVGEQAMERARQAGFQLVHASSTAALDNLWQQGLYGWMTVGSEESVIRKRVTAAKDHPGLLMWETEDEPSYQWRKPGVPRVAPERIHAAYRLLKQLDPHRPVYLNHAPTNLVETLARYNPGGDVIATDIYPVIPPGIRPQYALWEDGQQGDFLDTTISQVGRYVDKMRQVAGAGRGVWMVLQGFAWEKLRDGDQDPKMVLYPTLAQTRFMAWQAVAHGVTGLLWWGLYKTPPEAPLWGHISAVAAELNAHGEELAAPLGGSAPELTYHDTGHSLDKGIERAMRGRLLVAVNADKNPVEITWKDGPAKGRRERLEPFGVRLYKS